MRKTEMTRLVELGNSFIQLGNALQQMEVQPPRQQTDIIQEIYNKVYQQVCRFCPKESWVLAGRKQLYSGRAEQCLQHAGGVWTAKAACFFHQVSGTLQPHRSVGNCAVQPDGILQAAAEPANAAGRKQSQYCQPVVLLGEQIQLMRTGNGSYEQTQRLLVGHASSKKEQVSGDSWGVQDLGDGRMVQILMRRYGQR